MIFSMFLPPSGMTEMRRELQIGRHFHRGNRHDLPGERRILDLAARENVGDGMADQFADAQQALRRSGVFWSGRGMKEKA